VVSPETEHLVRVAIAADVYNIGTAIYWRRRAETFEWAKPRLGENRGDLSDTELSAAWQRCHATAEACRNRARLAEMGGDSRDDETRAA
jgi:hypothetical protein